MLHCILVSVRCACTGGCVVFCGHVLTCTGQIYCNACNRIEQLVQVPCIDSGFLPSPGMATQLFQACTLMGFVVATEGVLRRRAYFGPGLSTQPSGFTTPR